MIYLTDNDNENQGTQCNKTSVNICVEVEHLRESIDHGTFMYSQNCQWREILPLMTASLKALNMTLDSNPRINNMKLMG